MFIRVNNFLLNTEHVISVRRESDTKVWIEYIGCETATSDDDESSLQVAQRYFTGAPAVAVWEYFAAASFDVLAWQAQREGEAAE